MSFLSILEKAELEEKLNKDAKNWKQEREIALKKTIKESGFPCPSYSIGFDVVDVNPEKSRRKDQAQWEMYRDSYYSGY